MYPIKTFCEKTLWLEQGKIKMLGKSEEVANLYMGHQKALAERFKTENSMVLPENDKPRSFLFISNLTVRQEGDTTLNVEFLVKTLEPFYGHLGWSILRRDMLQISFMTTHMQGRGPVSLEGEKKIRIRIENLNLVNDNYFVYIGVFDKQAYKPIAVDFVDFPITTGYEIHNSLNHFDSTFVVE